MSSTDTYFVAATIVTSGPTSSRTRSRRAAICSADKAKDALCPPRPTGAPLREEEVVATAGAEVDALDLARPRPSSRLLGRRPEIELAVLDDGVAESGPERVGGVLASPRGARAR